MQELRLCNTAARASAPAAANPPLVTTEAPPVAARLRITVYVCYPPHGQASLQGKIEHRQAPRQVMISLREKPSRSGAARGSAWIWPALGVLLAIYVAAAWRASPAVTFGALQDDTLYFSSAKALAAGQGYILPNFPGHLRATKYPELYPLLLAGVWRADSHFPENLNLAAALTLAFGAAALVVVFLMLRRWPGVGDWPALMLTALCTFTAYFLYLSVGVMSDVPFMALTLAAAWLAQLSLESDSGAAALSAGAIAGLSVGMRSLGIAAVAGIGLVMLAKGARRRLTWFCVAALPLTLLWLWPAAASVLHPRGDPLRAYPTATGWGQTLCYYSSYGCNWRMNVTNLSALEAVAAVNLKGMVQQPGLDLLSPIAPQNSLLSLVLVMLLSVGAYVGIVRHWRRAGWQPVHAIFLLYLALILPWPYTPDRFLLVFMPLFFGGLWLEGRGLAALVTARLKPGAASGERIAAAVLGLAVLALMAMIAANFLYSTPREIGRVTRDRRRLLAAKQGAYNWIRQHAPPGARIIAYEDGLAYLYTGRQSIRPIASLTQAFYMDDMGYAQRDAAHLTDVARHVNASYWLISPDDFALESPSDSRLLPARERQLLAAAPVVYRSADGSVTLYDVRGLWGGAEPGQRQKLLDSLAALAPNRAAHPPPRTQP
jgi:hypothetical protein